MRCCVPEEAEPALLQPGVRSDGTVEQKRGCTDFPCLLLLLLFLVPAAVIAAAAWREGDLRRLTHGEDYTGKLCGLGDLADRPYVFYPQLANDLQQYQGLISSAPWAIPLYGLCVPGCPLQGDRIQDYPCEQRSDRCGWRSSAADAPPWAARGPNEWRVAMDTMAVGGRCMPLTRTASEGTVRLCAYPDCVAAGKPCYTDAFAEARYWALDGRRLQDVPVEPAPVAVSPSPSPPPPPPVARGPVECLEFVTLDTTRTRGSAVAPLELEYVARLFGGAVGVAADVYRGWVEVALIGVGVTLLANVAILLLLDRAIQVLFYTTAVALLLVLCLVSAVAFGNAGWLELPAAFPVPPRIAAAGTSVGGLQLALPPELPRTAATVASSAAFAQAQSSSSAHWALAGAASSLLTIGVFLALLSSWRQLHLTLEICRSAARSVKDHSSLLALPLAYAAAALAALGAFGLVSLCILTPDAETIAVEIDALATAAMYRGVALTNHAADAVADAARDAISGVNELAAERLHADDGLLGVDVGGFRTLDAEALARDVSEVLAPSTVAWTALAFEAVACAWLLLFLDGLLYCTIAGTIAHAIEQKEAGAGVLAATRRVARYHLGSVALGAASLGAVSGVRGVLAYVERIAARPRSATATPLLHYLLCCCRCFSWCYDRCLKYLTRFAYVQVAAHGQPFCAAATRTFGLFSAHPGQLMVNEAALAVLSLLFSLLTPLSTALVAYLAVVRRWRSVLAGASIGVGNPLDGALGEWSSGIRAPALLANASSALDDALGALASSVSGSIPDWDAHGPPSALNVALATLAVSFCITQVFRRVYAATVDTWYVLYFFQHDEGEMLAGRGGTR